MKMKQFKSNEMWLFHIIIIIDDDNDSHHQTLIKIEGCVFKKGFMKVGIIKALCVQCLTHILQ